ncbi:hypothetical protein GGI43DRAFT_397177 [Trichoderma evansii]
MANLAITTPYILYYIFLHLPQQDLLLVQRVCRTWGEVISSNKTLLAILFLCPEPVKGARLDGSFELNPLLQSRFPSFFDVNPMSRPPHPWEHEIGPWFHSHWTEHIHPWPVRQNRCGRQPKPIESPKLDPRRAAAYKYPKASWRRMIPCMPPPIELQVSFEYQTFPRAMARPTFYTLRCLKFSNEILSNKGASTFQDSADGEWRQPWLTFGLLYDIVEAAWFQSIPTPVSTAQFDYSFQETRPYIWKPSSTPGHPPRPTPEEKKTIFRYGRREKLRDLLPDKMIGGPGRILVLLAGNEIERNREKRYSGQFEVDKGAVQNLEWDEEIDYKIEGW